mgnify:CR=1 FL=1
MAIIIRSSDIYEKNNHNIMLNNAIKSVSVQEKSLKIGDTTQGNHKEYPDPNPLNESLYSTTIYDGLAAAYFERMECIKYSLIEAGVPQEEFDIVPFPINFPEKIFNYVSTDAKYYMTIYDKWGEEKLKTLKEDLNLDVEVLWKVSLEDKGISASDIRKNIQEGKEWKEYVPNFVYKYITENNLDKRIKTFLDEDEKYLGKEKLND